MNVVRRNENRPVFLLVLGLADLVAVALAVHALVGGGA